MCHTCLMNNRLAMYGTLVYSDHKNKKVPSTYLIGKVASTTKATFQLA